MFESSLRSGWCLMIAGLTAACSAGGMPRGENMLMAMPIPEDGWTVTSARGEQLETRHWERAGTRDMFVVETARSGEPLSPARFRSIMEENNRKDCLTFESQILSEEPRNGFPSLLLFVSCEKKEEAMSRLFLFIEGKDADYAFTRSWPKKATAAEIDAWSKYLADATVCDTRPDRKAPCPIGDKGGNIQVTGDNKIVAK